MVGMERKTNFLCVNMRHTNKSIKQMSIGKQKKVIESGLWSYGGFSSSFASCNCAGPLVPLSLSSLSDENARIKPSVVKVFLGLEKVYMIVLAHFQHIVDT